MQPSIPWSSVSVFVTERMGIIHSLKYTVPFSFVLPLAVTCCHSLSFVVPLVVTRCTSCLSFYKRLKGGRRGELNKVRFRIKEHLYGSFDEAASFVEHFQLLLKSFIKVGLLPSKNFALDWKPLKKDEKYFLLHLKSSFRSQDIYVFVKIFWSYRKKRLD